MAGWELIQTDGGSEFKEAFAERVLAYCQRHRVARPYKKNEQAYIESFNRTVRKECLGWTPLQRPGPSPVPEISRAVPGSVSLPPPTPRPRTKNPLSRKESSTCRIFTHNIALA